MKPINSKNDTNDSWVNDIINKKVSELIATLSAYGYQVGYGINKDGGHIKWEK